MCVCSKGERRREREAIRENGSGRGGEWRIIGFMYNENGGKEVQKESHLYSPSKRSLSSLRASRLSLRSCLSISWLILFCSFASSLRQHAMFLRWPSELQYLSLSLFLFPDLFIYFCFCFLGSRFSGFFFW